MEAHWNTSNENESGDKDLNWVQLGHEVVIVENMNLRNFLN